MYFVYLDDFGHVGPYFSADHPSHNTSPVYGYAGFALPAPAARSYSSFFLQLKTKLLEAEIVASGKPAHRWEKKGASLFRKTTVARYASVREAGFRLLNEIGDRGGFAFYYGREKIRGRTDLNHVGFQRTILSHATRRLDAAMRLKGESFALVVDQNSAGLELLEAAQKTMFGNDPCRCLVSAPFEVASHLDQCIQAADWIAAIVGRLWALRLDEDGFESYRSYETYFGERLARAQRHSHIMRRSVGNDTRALEAARS